MSPLRLLPLSLLPLYGCTLSELSDQRAVWEAQGLDDYSFVLQKSCFCPNEYTDPVLVTVAGDAVVDAVYTDQSELAGQPAAADYGVVTVDGLFDLAEDAVREADEVEIEYDATWGFPTAIRIDYMRDAIDDELSVFASELAPG